MPWHLWLRVEAPTSGCEPLAAPVALIHKEAGEEPKSHYASKLPTALPLASCAEHLIRAHG
eukprot:10295374-Alexandrium_andersonii.AAC.1